MFNLNKLYLLVIAIRAMGEGEQLPLETQKFGQHQIFFGHRQCII